MTENYFLVEYTDNSGTNRLALQTADGVFALDGDLSLSSVLEDISAADLIDTLNNAKGAAVDAEIQPIHTTDLLQVWAAGVTYKISEEARERESNNSTIYTRVYDAERPEIFMKASGYEVVRSGDPAGIRKDATWSVPEPELGIVVNSRKEVIGFTIGNDMSSRDIEGENPLYLPQAKVYDNACVIGPRIWLQPNAGEWPAVEIEITIERGGEVVFNGKTATSQIHRTLAELVEYLGRCKAFPYGAILLTGTGVVPSDDFTLQADDVVTINIEPIGTLSNKIAVV